MQWLNYSARRGGSLQAQGLKGPSSSPKDREQRWGSRPPTMGFRAFNAFTTYVRPMLEYCSPVYGPQ